MGIGVSIFLIAVGAILTWAVSATVSGLSIGTVGVILMAVGAIGLLWSLIAMGTVYRGRTIVRDEPVVEHRTVVRDY
jgi:protein-S-isoprenylcysteine O-methyltransferase Ste14